MTPAETLDQMTKRLEAAKARSQAIQVRLESARQQLADGRKEADATHKTSDVGELKAILARQETANTQTLVDFDKAVTDYAAFIGRIEEAMNNPVVMAEMLTELPELPAAPEAAPAAQTAAQAGVDVEDI